MLESFKILVLNYSYEPLQFCNAKRALIMVLSGRAEGLEVDGYQVKSPNATYPLPTVIRVLKMVRKKKGKSISFSKKNILKRDNFTCQYCGEKPQILTIDHIIPKSRGGETTWNNVVVACKPCNLKKSNKTLDESGLVLAKKPIKPNFYLYSIAIPPAPKSHIECWNKYLPKKMQILIN
jgi:5-methylcytosine-specific restriction endonuclease McrA